MVLKVVARNCAAIIVLFLSAAGFSQELTYLPLQRPGQASVAVDRDRHVAFVIDLGNDRAGSKILFDGKPLLDRLEELGVRHIVFSCSHPHADHMGGIQAIFNDPGSFFQDGVRSRPRFDAITVIDDGVKNSLYNLLKNNIGSGGAIKAMHVPALGRNAFAGLSAPGDAVFVENVPYMPIKQAGPHGRSIVGVNKLY